MQTLIRNVRLLKPEEDQLIPNAHVLIENGRITTFDTGLAPQNADEIIDGGGQVLMPGLIDCHVHAVITTMDFAVLRNKPATVIAFEAAAILKNMLSRGFTTVRDAGGADYGLARAIETGLIPGPRLYYSGRVISQTGGHGDIVPAATEQSVCACSACTSWFSHVVDGPDAVRSAVRMELKKGAKQIKLMASGGVASASDPLMSLQLTDEEMRAATGAANDWGTYTLAHAYSPGAITRAIHAGVRTIEHGNLLDEESALLMARNGAYLVPTLVTYGAMKEYGDRYHFPAHMQAKNHQVIEAGLESLDIAGDCGVPIGFGTDLLGELHEHQSEEFSIRAQRQPPIDIIRSATLVNAEILRETGQLGTIESGAHADMILLDANPLEDIEVLANPADHLVRVLKAGQVVA